MPPVIAAVAGIAAVVAGATGTALAIAGVTLLTAAELVSLGVSLVLSGASALLAKKPEGAQFLQAGQTVTIRSPDEPLPLIYGETRVGGVIEFLHSTSVTPAAGASLDYLHMVVVLAGHECESIGAIYFDDEVVPLGGSGIPSSGQYADKAGVNYVRVKKHLGAWDQAADADLIAECAGLGLNASDRFRGLTYLYIRLRYNTDVFPNGVPNVTAVVKGRKVFDPREGGHDASDPGTWTWSDNWALCVLDYVRGVPMRLGAGAVERVFGAPTGDADIDIATYIAAANISDESVPVAGGGSEGRFTVNGRLSASVEPESALAALLTAGSGFHVWAGGKSRLFAGAYQSPSAALGVDDLRGPLHVQVRRARRDLFNGVKGVFAGPSTNWQRADFPAIASETYRARDNGERIWRDIELPFTAAPSMAQRLAKIELLKNRQEITVVFPAKLTALKVAVGDTVTLTIASKGWSEKEFLVIGWALSIDSGGEGGAPTLGVDLTLQETDASIYAWETSEEQTIDPAPDTTLPDPRVVLAPGAPLASEALYATRDSAGVKARVTMAWNPSVDAFLREYQPEYRVNTGSGFGAWIKLPRTPDAIAFIDDAAPGVYDFRVTAINQLGRASEAALTEGVTVYGLGAAPGGLSGVSLQLAGGLALLSWNQVPELDVRIDGIVEFRHSHDLAATNYANAVSIGKPAPGAASQWVLPLREGTYFLRAIDSTGNPGPASSIATKQATALAFAPLSTVTEHATFTGTKTDCEVSGGVLKLSAGETSGLYAFAAGQDLASVKRVRLTPLIAATITNTDDLFDGRSGNIDTWEDFDGVSGGEADAWVEARFSDDGSTWTSWRRLDAGEAIARYVEYRLQLTASAANYNIEIAQLSVTAEEVA